MLGGYGYMEEYPARLLRDSRLGPIGGTSKELGDIVKK
jgi:alkylation response protein AidB-like acyl-CoA dehydrogenase